MIFLTEESSLENGHRLFWCRGKIGSVKLRLLSLVFPGNKNLLSVDLPGY